MMSPGPPATSQPLPGWGERLSGGCCQGGDREHTLTFGSPSMSPDPGRRKESPVQGLARSSVQGPPNASTQTPNILPKRTFYPGNIFLFRSSCGDWAQWSLEPRQRRLPGKSGRVLTYLTSRSCGVAPCRPCPPSGRPSLDPLGTVGEAQSVAPERAHHDPRRAPYPATRKCGPRELPPWRSCSH